MNRYEPIVDGGVWRPRNVFDELSVILHFDIRDLPLMGGARKHGLLYKKANGETTVFSCPVHLNARELVPNAHFQITQESTPGQISIASFSVDCNYIPLRNVQGDAQNWLLTVIDLNGTQRSGMVTDKELRGEFVFWVKDNLKDTPRLMGKFVQWVRHSQERIAARDDAVKQEALRIAARGHLLHMCEYT